MTDRTRPGIAPATDRADPRCAVLARNWWAVALRGVFAILFGVVAFAFPGATILSLLLFFSAYMLVDGVFAIIAAVRAARAGERWGLLVLEGVADILTGVIIFVWPGISLLAFVLLTAAWAVVSGVLMAAAAFRLPADYGRWWLVIGGVASVIFGVLLAIAPLTGLVVLTWWLGAYALVFGVALLVLGFRLRSRSQEAPPAATAQPV